MVSGADVAARARQRTATIRVNLNGELLGQIDDLKAELRQARQIDQRDGESLASKAQQIIQQIRTLEIEATDTATTFRARTVPGETFDELKRQYPPTPDQWSRYKTEAETAPILAQPPEMNFQEVIPRLIGLSVVEVDGEPVDWTEDDGIALWNGLYDGARADLGDEIWKLNNRSALRPTSGIGTDETPTSDPELTMSSNGASHSPSS